MDQNDYSLKTEPKTAPMETVWAFDLGKGSIGEAVRRGNEFLHKASLLIPPEFAETKTVANCQWVVVRKHLPDVLKRPPISHHGNVNEINGKFGGPDQLRTAVNQLQSLLYAAQLCLNYGSCYNS